MTKKLLVFALLLQTLVFTAKAQTLTVAGNTNANTLAQNLAGPGVVVSNATLTGATNSSGIFTTTGNPIGLGTGILLTTGDVANAVGPNNNTAQSTDWGTSGADIAILEFDVVPIGNSLNFRYVFGSEEYPEYVCSNFNDNFTFEISGPIPGGGNYVNTNIALIPSTNIPVTINTVNPGVAGASSGGGSCTSLAYSTFYNDNTNGVALQYDGYTDVFVAVAAVIPCQTYRLRLTVADVFDDVLDSGVFLEENSLQSVGNTVTPAVVSAGYTSTFEGCVNGNFTITLSQVSTTTTVINYVLGGTATNGSDYTSLSGTVTVPAGSSSVIIPLTPLQDGILEGQETVTLSTVNICNGQILSTGTLFINDVPQTSVTVNPTSICAGGSSTLTVNGGVTGNTYSWSAGTTPSNAAVVQASPASTQTYTVTVTTGSCTASNTGTVTVNPSPTVVASVIPITTVCAGTTVQLNAAASGGTPGYIYNWSSGVSNAAISNPTAAPNSTTIYTVTVTDLSSCTATSSVTVNTAVGPTVSIGANQNVCSGQTVTLSASGGPYVTYAWSNGLATPTITVGVGTYSVTVNNGVCDAISNTVVISNFAVTPAPLRDTSICSISPVNYSTFAGATNILWSTGETTSTITVNSTGNYSYTATDANGCPVVSDTANVSISAGLNVTATVTPTGLVCAGSTVQLNASASNGTPIYTYNWSAGVSDITIANPTATPTQTTVTYTVTITDANSCSGTAFVTVNTVTLPPVSIGNSQTLCGGVLTVTLTPSGGPYTSFAWSNGQTTPTVTVGAGTYNVTVDNGICVVTSNTVVINTGSNTNAPLASDTLCDITFTTLTTVPGAVNIVWNTTATTSSITVSTNGDYYYTANDANGCIVTSDTATILFSTSPFVNATASPDTICLGGSSVLSSGAAAGLTYIWFPNIGSTPLVTVTVPGQYIVTVSNGICSATDTVQLYEFVYPPITLTNDTTLCEGDSILLFPSNSPYTSYVWNTGEITPTITVDTAGSYSVTVTDANCTYISDTFNLTISLTTVLAFSDTTVCIGQPVTVSSELSLTNILWNTAEPTPSILVFTAGDYFYTATNAIGCNVVSDTATVNFVSPPVVNLSASQDTICLGASSVLNSGAVSGLTYTWFPNVGSTSSVTVTQPGQYIVTVSDGSCSSSDTIVVYQYQQAPVVLNNDTTVCPGSSVVLTPSGAPYLTYSWSNGLTTPTITVAAAGSYSVTVTDANCTYVSDTFVLSNFSVTAFANSDTTLCIGQPALLTTDAGSTNILWNTAQTTSSILVTIAGNYFYTAINANGCPVSSDTATVTFVNPPVVNPTASPDTICLGGSSVLSSGAATGLTYAWSVNGAVTTSTTVTAAGTYTVTVSDGSCSASASVTVFQYQHAPVVLRNDTSICNGASLILAPSDAPYVTYNWSNGLTTPTITVAAAGSYSVTVTDANCTYISDTFTLSVFTTTALAYSDTAVCVGQTVPLTTDAGLTNILWNTNANTSSISVTLAGNYFYTATNANGCAVRSDTATVSFVNPPLVNPTASPDTICPGGSSVLSSGAAAGLTYAWSVNSAVTTNTTVTAAGTYTVTVRDGSCSASGTVSVAQFQRPPVVLNNDAQVCVSNSVTLAPSGAPYLIYLWSNGLTTPTINVSTAGSYSVQVTDANCTYLSDTFVLTNFPVTVPTVLQGASICDGGSATLTAQAGFTNYGWSPAGNTQTITVTTAGNYSYTATDANGCTVQSTVAIVSLLASPTPNITASPSVICVGQGSSTLDAGSEVGVSYVWSLNNATTNTIQVSATGTYTVTASRGNCTASDAITITAGNQPVLQLNPVTSCCQQVVLNPTTTAGNTYLWSDGTADSTLTITTTGNDTLDYSVTVTSAEGCTASVQTSVLIKCIDAQASAEPDTISIGGTSVLNVTTAYNGNFSYSWTPTATLDTATKQNPTATPTEQTTYTVVVSDLDDVCSSTSSIVVYVILSDKIAMPNAFTPNGDGKNDGFYPILTDRSQVVTEFRIYNRWGQRIHNTTDTWNGEFESKDQPAGTYIYYIIVRVPDQENANGTKEIKLEGSFTLVR